MFVRLEQKQTNVELTVAEAIQWVASALTSDTSGSSLMIRLTRARGRKDWPGIRSFFDAVGVASDAIMCRLFGGMKKGEKEFRPRNLRIFLFTVIFQTPLRVTFRGVGQTSGGAQMNTCRWIFTRLVYTMYLSKTVGFIGWKEPLWNSIMNWNCQTPAIMPVEAEFDTVVSSVS